MFVLETVRYVRVVHLFRVGVGGGAGVAEAGAPLAEHPHPQLHPVVDQHPQPHAHHRQDTEGSTPINNVTFLVVISARGGGEFWFTSLLGCYGTYQ